MNALAPPTILRRAAALRRRPRGLVFAAALILFIAVAVALALHAHDPQRAALGAIALVVLLAVVA